MASGSDSEPQEEVVHSQASFSSFQLLGLTSLCTFSIRKAILNKAVSVKAILDILLFLGVVLLLSSTFKGHLEGEDEADLKADAAYTPLQGEDVYSSDDNVTPFAKAGFLSRMAFWWLNLVMKKGQKEGS
ncbi:hypothetical protein Ancab_032768 [Ancistrocladus abbreviatus]